VQARVVQTLNRNNNNNNNIITGRRLTPVRGAFYEPAALEPLLIVCRAKMSP